MYIVATGTRPGRKQDAALDALTEIAWKHPDAPASLRRALTELRDHGRLSSAAVTSSVALSLKELDGARGGER